MMAATPTDASGQQPTAGPASGEAALPTARPMAPLVTISATYGAGGSVIAPRLAERLGLPFIDRVFTSQSSVQDAIPALAACGPSAEGLTAEEEAATPSNRFFAYLARSAGVGGMLSPEVVVDEDDTIRRQAEADLVGVARGQGGVLLGRGGAVVLARRPRAYHVRLDGPESRRIERAVEFEHLDQAQAARRQAETDRARVVYVRRLYRADPTDMKWYHLRLDSTVLTVEQVVEVLHRAVTAFMETH